ncbi:hypothetical protein BH10PSE11_BH10PSE11_13830 [soil metagenome]|jgi:hypothetical protein
MLAKILEWWCGPTVVISEVAEPDPPDVDRLAQLIQHGDPSDQKTFEEIAGLFGQSDHERF